MSIRRPKIFHAYRKHTVDHLLGRDAAICFQRQAFPGVLVDDRQPLHWPTVAGPIVDEVPSPYVVLVFGLRRPRIGGFLAG